VNARSARRQRVDGDRIVRRTGSALSKIGSAVFLILCWVAPAFCQTNAEQQKIDYLIHSIETLQDATFIRNGIEYDARTAANHLRLKLRFAGNRVQTAEDFIVNCATASSMSAQKYQIKFQDGRVVEAANYLRNKLNDYVAEPNPPLTSSTPRTRMDSEDLPRSRSLKSPSFPAAGDRIRA
jgi:hypothetical protein